MSDFFSDIYPYFLRTGLYIEACQIHQLDIGTTSLPYDYVYGYEFIKDKNYRLYGGEIGLFLELENNVKMLHEIYQENPVFEIDEEMEKKDLFNDIKNGIDTSGKYWNTSTRKDGAFTGDEVPYIQQLLLCDEGLKIQKQYLFMNLYGNNNNLVIQKMMGWNCTDNAKSLACIFLVENFNILYWIDNAIEDISNLKDMADFLLGMFANNDDKIIQAYNYLKQFEGEE